MNSEVLACCSALGFDEGYGYQKEPDCLETVKDLIRFLRRDRNDETSEVRIQLGSAQILLKDLIPLMKEYPDDNELFEAVLRLTVNLSQPPELCFQNKVPEDKTFRHYYLQLLSQLQAAKEHFADEDLMTVFAKKLKHLLDMEWDDRREEHTLLLERILLVIRNVLHIPANPHAEKRTDDDVSVHDQVIWAINVSGLNKLLLYIASAPSEQQWCMHILEVISLLFREQDPGRLAASGLKRSLEERSRDQEELLTSRHSEQSQQTKRFKQYNTRHSRFGGSFYVKNMKSISEHDLIYHRSVNGFDGMSFDAGKAAARLPKRRRPVQDTNTATRQSSLALRLFLKEFCVLFLQNCYNPLMHCVRSFLNSQNRAGSTDNKDFDETYYMWALKFFMSFNRHYKFRIDVVRETFSVETFHFVHQTLLQMNDNLQLEKKEVTTWSRRTHASLRAYHELFMTLQALGDSAQPAFQQNADVLKSNIFYISEYRQTFVDLLRHYNPTKYSRSFLKDLVEATHVFIKMLEKFCDQKKTILVQKKKRRKLKPRKRKQGQASTTGGGGKSSEELEALWEGASGPLSALLQGREDLPSSNPVVPFDAASDKPVEDQRRDALATIQRCLHHNQAGEAVALFRAAREVWPEGNVFGAPDIEEEDEFMALREIHFTPIQGAEESEAVGQGDSNNMGGEEETLNEEGGYLEEEDEEEEMELIEEGEEVFDIKGFLRRFAHPLVIKPYVSLLASYRQNSGQTNYYIVKMMHRVAVKMKMYPMFYQLSLFRVFQNLLADPAASAPQFQELVKFAKYLIGQFFSQLADDGHNNLFVETLFWKDVRDVIAIGGDDLDLDLPVSRKKKLNWTERTQQELESLFDQYKDREDPEMDVVDHIMVHFSDKSKTRKQILFQMVRQELIGSVKDIKKKPRGRRNLEWREEDEAELRHLYARHQGGNDVLGEIVESLGVRRSRKKVSAKLLELGVVQDKKELYKKRKRKSKANQGHSEDDESDQEDGNLGDRAREDSFLKEASESDETDSEDEEEEEEGERSPSPVIERPPRGQMSLAQLVKRVRQLGLEAELEWIRQGLVTTADEREIEDPADYYECGTCIVPSDQDKSRAMGNKTFLQLLKKIGFSAPANHQETFWRIPGDLTPQDLRKCASQLTDSLEGVAATQPTSSQSDSEKENQSLAKKKRIVKDVNHVKRLILSESESENEERIVEASPKKIDLQPFSSLYIEPDEDSSDAEEDHRSKEPPVNRRGARLGSDSSDAEENQQFKDGAVNRPGNRMRLGSDEESEDGAVNRPGNRMRLGSDEESENGEMTYSKKRPLKALMSDDSDSDDDVPLKKPISRIQLQPETDSD